MSWAQIEEATGSSIGSSMRPVMDPEEREIEALRLLGEMGESRTLEIGSGDGRLARRLHALTSPVTGIDCCLETLASARSGCSFSSPMAAADACSLPFHDNSFDQVVFGWAL